MNWHIFNPPQLVADILAASPQVYLVGDTPTLSRLATGNNGGNQFEVAYDIPGKGRVVDAVVAKVKNGLAVNFSEAYMRRRDPDCMLIGDDLPTDKDRFQDRYTYPFSDLRQQTFDWLKSQELVVFAFQAGRADVGLDSIVVAPANAGFFALGLAMLQGILPLDQVPADFKPNSAIFIAPIFRHTHFEGRQVVVHNRQPDLYEMYSFNLYPGPSAKKGVYGMLIEKGEHENWVTTHCSTVQVVTPYDNVVTIMHEGASGGGKSEMLEQAHREQDGRLLYGENLVTGETRHLTIPRSCDLYPVSDDMALCHPGIQQNNGKLSVIDAENAWFVRVNHITNYGSDPYLEKLTAQPAEPLLFLNIDAVPSSRALIWEHIEDSPNKPCPNPRVIVPRGIIPNNIPGAVNVDVRSFGVRTPPCTREQPTYGILGMFHIIPPALAWLWRLVSPRGFNNPSIIDSEGLASEGVGSYWPFSTGRRVTQANLLLDQFATHTRTRNILIPNQHIGAWQVGFMAQWVAREYLARRGSTPFKPEQLRPCRCPLLGYTLYQLHVEGSLIARWFLQVHTQPEVGEEAYDRGAEILYDFFREQLQLYLDPELHPLGRQIIECCLNDGSLEDYEALIPEM
jgi:hypothetical protein